MSFIVNPPGGGDGAGTGPAGGVLSGNYPNPGFASDMATQAELDVVADAALTTFRWSHTFTYPGETQVALLPGFFVPEASGTAVSLIAVRHQIGSGTSATWTVQINGSDVTGLTSINSSTSATTTDVSDVAMTADDYVDLDITGVSGTPKDLRVSVLFEVARS